MTGEVKSFENSKKIFIFFGGGGGGGLGTGRRGRSQGGCERKIEVFVKIQKKNWGEGRVGGGGGVGRVGGCWGSGWGMLGDVTKN